MKTQNKRKYVTEDLLNLDPITQLEITREVRFKSAVDGANQSEIIETGIVPACIKFLLFSDNPKLEHEASWLISNICSGSKDDVKYLVDNNVIPSLFIQLKSEFLDIAEQTIWTFGNISCDSSDARDILIQEGIVDKISPLLNNEKLLLNNSWMISNLCRIRPYPELEKIKGFFPFFEKCLKSNDSNICLDAIWGIHSLIDNGYDLNVVMKTSFPMRLFKLLENNHVVFRYCVSKTLNLICVREHLHDLIKMGLFNIITLLLSSPGIYVLKAVVPIIFRVSEYGTTEEMMMLIESGVMGEIVSLDDSYIHIEFFWALSNLLSKLGNKVGENVVMTFIQIFEMTVKNEEVVCASLDCFQKIFNLEIIGVNAILEFIDNQGMVFLQLIENDINLSGIESRISDIKELIKQKNNTIQNK